MTTAAAITSDRPQASGRYATFEFDDGIGAPLRRRQWLADGVDAQAWANAAIPAVEDKWKRQELRHAAQLAFRGIDPRVAERLG